MKFSGITGQEKVIRRMKSSIERRRVPHAQLLLGPEGSGKLALALAYAQTINCTNPQNGEACGQCSNCHKYEKLIHPDLHFIFPTASTKGITKPVSDDFLPQWREFVLENEGYVNLNGWHKKIEIEKKQSSINTRDCQDIIRKLNYESYESEYKVMIIWMIEKLHHAAAPKILKILEEPPAKTLFLLISENHHKILKTILSRTQLIKIPPVDEEALRNYLLAKKYNPAKVRDVLPLAKGNLIRAKNLLENTEEQDYFFNRFVQWMRSSYGMRMEGVLAFADEMSKNSREKNISFLRYALRLVRESLLLNYEMEGHVRLTEEEKKFMTNFSPYVNPGNIFLLQEEINRAIYHIERNAQSNILFTDLSLKTGRLLRQK